MQNRMFIGLGNGAMLKYELSVCSQMNMVYVIYGTGSFWMLTKRL